MKNIKALKILLIGFVFSVFNVSAQLLEPFSPRYSETLKGDIAVIANNTVSLNRTQPYNGELNNNGLSMVNVDIDNDPTTFNSSSANLRNPAPNSCLTIDKVLLYWAAADKDSPVGVDNQPNWDYFDVKLRLPGETDYNTIRADEVIFRGRDTNFNFEPYVCFKDITDQVNDLTDPFGTYQVANVEGKIGQLILDDGSNSGTSGGWQIIVVYESPDFNLKNISVFDGYAHVTRDRNTFPINFDGFQTVPNGPVRAELLIGALEGDRSIRGDRLQIRNVANNFVDIVAPERPADNFFNGRITIGQPGNDNFTDRNPASLNTLGFDSALFPLRNPGNSIIGNNQGGATVSLTSTGEGYGLFAVGLSVEVFEPELGPITYSATPNPITPSDDPDENVITYGTKMVNNGNDNAINIEFNTTIALGSELIQPIVGLPAGVTYTYNNATRVLTFTAQNGLLDIGESLEFEFQVRINDRCTFLTDGCSTTLDSEIVGTYQGEINDTVQTTGSSSDVDVCGVGNDTSTKIEVNEPAPAMWTTNPGDLDVTLECDDLDGLEDAQILTPVADCDSLTPIKTAGPFVPDPNGCSLNGTYTNTWTFTDSCGRAIANFVQVITIQDTTPPDVSACVGVLSETAECAGDVDNEANALAWHQANLARLQGCAEDACNPDIEFTTGDNYDWANYVPNTGDCSGGGMLTVIYTLTDDCGNLSAELPAIYTIEDTTPPDVSACVGVLNETEECVGDAGNEANALAWHQANLDRLLGCAEDLCNPDTVFTTGDNYDWANYVPNTGDCSGGGTLTVIYTLTDDCGNLSAELPAVYTIEDTTPPDVSACVGVLNETEECAGDVDNEANALAWHQANLERLLGCAEDLCNPDTVFTTGDNYDWANYVPNTGDCSGGGTLTVIYTLTDDCGNLSAELPATYTIEDNTPPDVSACVGVLNETEECVGDAGNEANALAWHQANLERLLGCAEDLCNPDTVFTTGDNYDWANYVPNTGDCSGGGTLTVIYTLTDDCGNLSAELPATYTLEDTTPPDVSACVGVLNQTEECQGDDNNEAIAIAWHQANLDRLQGCAEDECNPNVVFTIDSDYDWANYDTSDACGAGGRLIVNYIIKDDCDNLSESLVAELLIEDTTGPQLITSIESEIFVVCTEVPEVPELEFEDGCSDAEITIEFEEVNGDLGDGSDYEVTRTWTVTDICDNTETYTQTINVTSEILPINLSDNRCFDDGPIDLFTYLPTDTDTSGEWVVVSTTNNNDIEVVGGVFDPSGLDQKEDLGDYVFSYTITKGFCLENTLVTIDINDLCVVKTCGLEDFTISKALTPNGDTFNEFFKITAVKECDFKVDLKIFNRYGTIVYRSENYQNDWGASTHGSSIGSADQLPNGTYYYVIVLTGDIDGAGSSGLKPIAGPLFIGTGNQ